MMSTAVDTNTQEMPREMMEHTYAVFSEFEESHWWFVGRRKIIEMFIKDIAAQFERRPQIVDVGSGTGANILMLQEYGDVTGIDVSREAIDFCKQRGLENVKLGAAEAIPMDDRSADVVTALDVVEHLDDDVGCLRECRRILRSDGRILLFVPAFMFLWGIQDDVSRHRRRYTMPQLQKAVEEAGFAVERSTYVNIIFFLPIFLVRKFMRIFRIKTDTEISIGISPLNGIFTWIFSSERAFLRLMNFPFGVSAVCIARPAPDSGTEA